MNDTTYGRQLNYLKMRVSLDVEMEPLVDRDMDIGAEGSLQTPSARPGTKRRGIWILREVVGFTNRALKSKDANVAQKRGLMSFIFGFTTSKSDSLRETAWLDGLRGIAAFLVMVYRKFFHSLEQDVLTIQTSTWTHLHTAQKGLTERLEPTCGKFGGCRTSELSGARAMSKSAYFSCYPASFCLGRVYRPSARDDMRNWLFP